MWVVTVAVRGDGTAHVHAANRVSGRGLHWHGQPCSPLSQPRVPPVSSRSTRAPCAVLPPADGLQPCHAGVPGGRGQRTRVDGGCHGCIYLANHQGMIRLKRTRLATTSPSGSAHSLMPTAIPGRNTPPFLCSVPLIPCLLVAVYSCPTPAPYSIFTVLLTALGCGLQACLALPPHRGPPYTHAVHGYYAYPCRTCCTRALPPLPAFRLA